MAEDKPQSTVWNCKRRFWGWYRL